MIYKAYNPVTDKTTAVFVEDGAPEEAKADARKRLMVDSGFMSTTPREDYELQKWIFTKIL